MDTSYSFTAGAEDLLKRANFPKEAVPAPTDGSGRWDKASLTQFLASQGITVVEQPIEQQVPAAPTSFAPPPSPEAQIVGIGDAASAEVVPGGETMDSLFADGASSFDEISQRIYRLVSSNLPADQAVRMLLKPLLLSPKVESRLRAPISKLACGVMAY